MEHNRYNKLGIICEEEKNILLDMINEFKDKIWKIMKIKIRKYKYMEC